MHATPLPGGVQNFTDGRFETLMRVGHNELNATQAAARQAAQEFAPERFRLRGTDRHAEHLAPPVRIDSGGIVTATLTIRPASRTFM